MRVFVTGATGFIGRALVPRLHRDGHAVVAWVRSPRARDRLGAEVELVHADAALGGLVAAIERCDAVVIFGEAATVLVASQRVDPRVLREHQFAFDSPTLDAARLS